MLTDEIQILYQHDKQSVNWFQNVIGSKNTLVYEITLNINCYYLYLLPLYLHLCNLIFTPEAIISSYTNCKHCFVEHYIIFQ